MFVYIVTEKVFDEYKIRGIYSDRKKAMTRVNRRKKESEYAEIWCDTYVLDSEEDY